MVDERGRPAALSITAGQLGDARAAIDLIAAVPASRSLAADTAYDSDAIRRFLIARGTLPVVPNKSYPQASSPLRRIGLQATQPHRTDVLQLKDFRRIATRYDKLAANYAAAVHLWIDPSSLPSARSACDSSFCSSPVRAIGGFGGSGAGTKAR